MAVEHKEYPIFGLQFHPESVMTPDGKIMIENFMKVSETDKTENSNRIKDESLQNRRKQQ